jgi:hypothetical protein
MTAREKIEFDRVDAWPRKTSGLVAYYFKPQTKYPPRIYVFMHAEIWCDRNRRPMGLCYAQPFLTRPMNKEAIEYHHFNIRLCYHQYADWDKLIYAEEQEAEELDKESPGTGAIFLEKIRGFPQRYPVGKVDVPVLYSTAKPPESGECPFIRQLIQEGQHFSAREIAELIDKEQHGEKRLTVLILLRELYKNYGRTEKLGITPEIIERKAFLSQERSRKNFVRRVYKKNKLFALQEIQSRYPDYCDEQLTGDLLQKTKKVKIAKAKPVLDLRRCQLEKLAFKLKMSNDETEYHQTCCRIVMLESAHKLRLLIPLTIKLQGEVLVYSFNWKTRERVVKSFVELANTKGMTHEQLKATYQELVQSFNSF